MGAWSKCFTTFRGPVFQVFFCPLFFLSLAARLGHFGSHVWLCPFPMRPDVSDSFATVPVPLESLGEYFSLKDIGCSPGEMRDLQMKGHPRSGARMVAEFGAVRGSVPKLLIISSRGMIHVTCWSVPWSKFRRTVLRVFEAEASSVTSKSFCSVT